jgi:hypothetical protein
MGSFAFTCSISGLPIEAGDPVRFLLLTENPYHAPAEHTCYMDDHWIPRTYPLKAKYNDYGSIEDIQQGPLQETLLEGFKIDLIERGTGDNQCHDVPVRADMGLEGFLEALWEGRVLVGRDRTHRDLEELRKLTGTFEARDDIHPGVPTLRSVSVSLTNAGLAVTDGNFAEGFLIDSQDFGFVRVRWGGHTKIMAMLQKAQEALATLYATMITTGTGDYHDRAELQVAPKPLQDVTEVEDKEAYTKDPSKFHYPHRFKGEEKTSPLHVAQAMIREDVWKALCNLKFKHWNDKVPSDCAGWKKAARGHYKALLEHKQRQTSIENANSIKEFMAAVTWRDTLQYGLLSPGQSGSAVVNLQDHLDLMASKGLAGQELEDFLDLVGEMHFIQLVLSALRYQWQPASSQGPQFGEWDLHLNYFKAITKVTADQVKVLKSK